jgi:DNA invertase Pin-like site-specific DNA recombinase
VNPGKLIAEFRETVSGLRNDRPQLSEALRTCRIRRATLIVARLDRLSRNLAFISALSESAQDFVIVDFPDANKFTIHILAAIAEYESSLISERLKSAFAAAKARGVVLGKPKGTKFPGGANDGSVASARAKQERSRRRTRDLAPIVWDMVAKGIRQAEIATALTKMGIRTVFGGPWSRTAITRILERTRHELGSAPQYRDVRDLGWRIVRVRARDAEIAPIVWQIQRQGKMVIEIADELNRLGIETPRRRGWTRNTVYTFLKRTASVFGPSSDSDQPSRPARNARRLELAKGKKLAVGALAWRLRCDGLSLGATAEELRRREVTPPREPWTRRSVRTVLALTATEFAEEALRAPLRRRSASRGEQ